LRRASIVDLPKSCYYRRRASLEKWSGQALQSFTLEDFSTRGAAGGKHDKIRGEVHAHQLIRSNATVLTVTWCEDKRAVKKRPFIDIGVRRKVKYSNICHWLASKSRLARVISDEYIGFGCEARDGSYFGGSGRESRGNRVTTGARQRYTDWISERNQARFGIARRGCPPRSRD